MSKAYVPKLNPGEKKLHIKSMMHQKLSSFLKSGKLTLAKAEKPKFPKVTLKAPKFKKGQ